MSEFRYIQQQRIVDFIRRLDAGCIDIQCTVVGLLYIDEEQDAAMELLDLTENKYIDYILKYIYP